MNLSAARCSGEYAVRPVLMAGKEDAHRTNVRAIAGYGSRLGTMRMLVSRRENREEGSYSFSPSVVR